MESQLNYAPLSSTLVNKTAEADVPLNYQPLPSTLGARTAPATLSAQAHIKGTHDARVDHNQIDVKDLLHAPSWLQDAPTPNTNPPLGYHHLSNKTDEGRPVVRVPCWRYDVTLAPRLIKTEAELDALPAGWRETPFPPAPESQAPTVDDRLREHAILADALAPHAHEGESIPDTLHRVIAERDAYAQAIAATVTADKIKE